MSYYKCERVVVKNEEFSYCTSMAQYISPPGIWTKPPRVIRVCERCKSQLTKYYQTIKRKVEFTRIEYAPNSDIQKGVPQYQPAERSRK